MSDKLERMGRSIHPVLGQGVTVKVRLWDFSKGREYWETYFFPKSQAGITGHPGHPSGYRPNTDEVERTACVSPSVSWFGELNSYAQFRWS